MNRRSSFGKTTLFLLLACASVFPQQTSMPRPTQSRPLQDRIADFEKPGRERWQKPDRVIRALKLKKADVVADIGAGTGYFTRRFARAVPQGKVYAVDVAEDILGYLKKEADKLNLQNIEIIVSREDDPMLPPGAVDLAFFCDTTHHIANRVAFYRKMSQGLKQGGRMAILDFPPDAPDKPHKPEQHVSRAQAVSEAE